MKKFRQWLNEGRVFNRPPPINDDPNNPSLKKLHKIIFSRAANDRSAWDALHPEQNDQNIIGDALLHLVRRHLEKTRAEATVHGKRLSRNEKV